jgi:hypothetical protein
MSCWPIGEEPGLPSGYRKKHGNFHSFPLKCCIYVDMDKNKRHVEKFLTKTLSGSSTNYFLPPHITFSQTQTGATVPLKESTIAAE